MAYLVLARKYRSTTFEEVVAQEPVAKTLQNAIATGRIAHAYLFTGTRGVGKTTVARILAKALNCLSSEQPVPTPCNQCEVCKAVSRGEDVDVVEIDGASNRGIDEIRELRANAIFRPSRCRFKIYYIDEVHMLTKEAFNALLKTLEEPPSHVKFIFATTEVEKVPATILSRCQRFDFHDIPTARIADHLVDLCRRENVQADQDALYRVARAASGSMRDALSLLDQLLAGTDHITDAEVVRVLGTPGDERTLAVARAVASADAGAALGELAAVLQSGVTLQAAVTALVETFRNMMVAASCGGQSPLIELPESQKQAVAELARGFTVPALVQAVGILQTVSRNIRGSSVARALVEAALVRLAEADKFIDPSSLVERLEAARSGQPARAMGPSGPAYEKKKLTADEAASGRPGGAAAGGPVAASPAGTYAPAPRPAGAAAPARAPQAAAPGASAAPPVAPPAPQAGPIVRPRAALSTAERTEISRDPAVMAVTTLFGATIEDIRKDESAAGPAEEEE